jgi:murein DD-endopeptidase MepM/ murein hydrolase activator NlpD
MNTMRLSRFTQSMIRENGLDLRGFQTWAFLPGMLFKSGEKWWGDRGKRAIVHEGVDFCLFGDRSGRLFGLDQGTKIPAMYTGTVVAIMNDFLGISVVLEHRFPDSDGLFLTIFGHMVVREGLRLKNTVRESEIIGTLIDSRKSRTDIQPHLHVSVARPSGNSTYGNLSWGDLNNPSLFTMIDPLDLIEGRHLVLDPPSKIPDGSVKDK